MLDSDEEDQ
jgi:hypothetical protein